MTRTATQSFIMVAAAFQLTACDYAANPSSEGETSGSARAGHIAIYNGAAVSPVSPQMIVWGGPTGGAQCTSFIYSAYWVITAAHCIANYDQNGDGIITQAEMNPYEPNACVHNGPDANGNLFTYNGTSDCNHVDLVVRGKEGVFGSATGFDVVLMHVTQPFGINWLVANRAASPTYANLKYTNGVLNLWTNQSLLPAGTILYSFGSGVDGQGHNGAVRWGTPQVLTDYTSWCSIGNRKPSGSQILQGSLCSGDSGGPTFYYSSSKYWLFGVASTASGCDANSTAALVDVRYGAQWIRDWTGT
jgi:hypothetical protein